MRRSSGVPSRVLENQIVALVLGLVFLVPVLFAGSPEQRTNQLTAYGFLGVLLVVAWLLRAQDRLSLSRVRSFFTTGPNLALGLFFLWSTFSALVSVNRHYSQLALIQLAAGILVYVMVVYHFRHRDQMRALLFCLLGLAVLAVLAVLGAFILDADRRLLDLAGSFHDRQLFGAFLGLLLPLLLGVAASAACPRASARAWRPARDATGAIRRWTVSRAGVGAPSV